MRSFSWLVNSMDIFVFWLDRVNYTIQNHIGKSGQNHLLGKTKSLDK